MKMKYTVNLENFKLHFFQNCNFKTNARGKNTCNLSNLQDHIQDQE